ncbi:hypothetical protein BRC80_12295 [Halobacteriales archaeon QH_9_66_26]|nr:MAG: hypothetical protein BRC80_12295 [Halobacteriales archaeon QH_9_66_26]
MRADEPAKKAEKAMEGTQDEQEEDDQTAEEQLPDDEGAVKKPELPARRRRAPCDCVLRPASATCGCRLT